MTKNDMQKLVVEHEKTKKRSLKRRFALSIALFVIFLCVVLGLTMASETFLRWYFSDILSSANGRTYFNNRSLSLFIAEQQNDFKLRGKKFNLIKNDRVVRVVVLGDSLAYGQGVWPYEKRFPEQALKIFQKRYPNLDIEIINTGIAGQDLIQHNRYLAGFILALKPDFVLYQWYINDMNTTYDDLAVFMAPPLISNAKWHKTLIEKSVLYFLFQRTWGQIRAQLGLQRNVNEHLIGKFCDPKSKYSLAANEQLNKLLNRLEQENIPHGIVLFPSFDTKMGAYQLGFLHKQVLDVCKEHDLGCLDLRQAYSKYDNQIKELWANIFDHHPSALAHRVAAEEIVDFYGDEWAKMASSKASDHN
jgi:lysophospholipase L1-like esterase